MAEVAPRTHQRSVSRSWKERWRATTPSPNLRLWAPFAVGLYADEIARASVEGRETFEHWRRLNDAFERASKVRAP